MGRGERARPCFPDARGFFFWGITRWPAGSRRAKMELQLELELRDIIPMFAASKLAAPARRQGRRDACRRSDEVQSDPCFSAFGP